MNSQQRWLITILDDHGVEAEFNVQCNKINVETQFTKRDKYGTIESGMMVETIDATKDSVMNYLGY